MARRRQAVTVTWEMGTLRLEYRPKRVAAAAGRAVAKRTKQALRRGIEPDGDALPRPRKGRPLRESGALIRSIKPVARRGRGGQWQAVVYAQGSHPDLDGRMGGRAAALLSVLIYGRRSWQRRPRMDPMDYDPRSMNPPVNEAVAKELRRQLQRGQARLVSRLTGRTLRRQVDAGLAGRLLRGGRR